LRHHRRSQPAISCLGAFRPPAVGVRGETIIPAAQNLHNYRRGLIRYFRSFRLGLILAAACRANVLLQSSKFI
jgi:hypothetical protein